MYITTSSSVPRVLLVWFFLLYSLGWTAPLAGPAELEISGPDQLNEALSRYSGIRNLPAPGEDDKSDSFLSVRADLPVVPGVNECFSKIQAWGVADNLPDVFFTAYPVNKNVAFHWGLDYFDEDLGATKANWKFAFWDRLADPSYMSDTANNLRTAMQNAGFSKKRRKYYQDRFLKNFSQAFAESAHGDVIVLLKQNVAPDNNWDSSTTWGGE
ncbi:hypothetical protein N7474_010025 [Penicillium riverlandense]|uniref:uncharacterized protein n=1 Tax=Penicillium riverlandense TaxID=1903569 RepID=UPI002547A6C1|nr:uncharacterized protein N7474_010025 [Penicillium riverlandense]KAJ5808756.1 hypothetical protein N7474_010025 [Penicillium riverlandense]